MSQFPESPKPHALFLITPGRSDGLRIGPFNVRLVSLLGLGQAHILWLAMHGLSLNIYAFCILINILITNLFLNLLFIWLAHLSLLEIACFSSGRYP